MCVTREPALDLQKKSYIIQCLLTRLSNKFPTDKLRCADSYAVINTSVNSSYLISKSLGDMQLYFEILDVYLADEKIPDEHAGQTQAILCNDCEKRVSRDIFSQILDTTSQHKLLAGLLNTNHRQS
ncbi:hypothetical protein AgCh_016738 [Apium graveolens]